MPPPVIFSLVFFAAFSIYFFFGIYILSLNPNEAMNRVFFYCCMAVGIWTFSFSMSNSAPDGETSLFWRRVAAIGWGSFYSFLLHVVLILTEKVHLLKNKWTYLLIYLPVGINVLVFSLYGDIAVQQYHLANTYAGWVNTGPASTWDRFYQSYYIGYSLYGCASIWRWGRSSKGRVKEKQAVLLVASYAVALAIGTITDFVINLYTPYRTPQLGPVTILAPMVVIFYYVRKHGFMTSEATSQEIDGVQILSEVTWARFYQNITLAFTLLAFLNFATQYFIYRAPLKSVAGFSGLILFNALFITVIRRVDLKTEVKDVLLSISLVTMIPLSLLVVFIGTAGTTVWSITFIFAILSIAFSNRRMLAMVGATTLVTLILVWVINPKQAMTISSTDHISRLVIFGIFLWVAFYINRIYFHRLAEKQEQVELQKLLSQISANLAITTEGNIDEKIGEVLKLLGEHFKVDRAYLFFFPNQHEAGNRTYEWRGEGIKSILEHIGGATVKDFSSWLDFHRLVEDGFQILKVAAPSGYGAEKGWPQEQWFNSLFVIPLVNKEQVVGFFGFDARRRIKNWSPNDQEILKVIVSRVLDLWLKLEAENKIAYMAYHDTLTGLPNRLLIEDRMEQAIRQAVRSGKQVAAAFIDIDNLKAINDTMGHDNGDALLIQVAQRLCAGLRKYDSVARFGGDEFLVMIPDISQLEDVRKVADQILGVFHEPMVLKDQEYFVTASIGVAVFPIDGETPGELIKHADLAMYASKEQGKNRYTLCSPVIKEEFIVNMELSNSLYRALERNELALYYQPKVITATGEIAGVEALIRWRHPHKGMISPNQFIPIAEKNGLINPIGQWVLRTACRQNKAWQDQGLAPIRMAVNLSLGQFLNKKLVANVAAILQETGLDPAYLELEITESIAIDEPEYISKTLDELKALGISIAIDDFGTQYSSLSRLKNLPIDRIKIDMLFVRGISKGSKQEGIIKAIFQLAKTLDLQVTAEGVETEQQLAFLREIACDEIQGFYYYRPMPLDETEAILRGKPKGCLNRD